MWGPPEILQQLREASIEVCDDYHPPEIGDWCETCHKPLLPHLMRAAADALAAAPVSEATRVSSTPDVNWVCVCGHEVQVHRPRDIGATGVCQVEDCRCQRFDVAC